MCSPTLWTVPDRETLLTPKYEVIGMIISAFQSREFCFVFARDDLSDAYLNMINYFRAEKLYMDKDAAKILRNGSSLNKNM